MEKIIQEFRVIETDDGFRIEIKGDKERLRGFMRGFGRHRHWRGHHRRPWGPFGVGFGPMMWAQASGCCGPWEAEEGEGSEDEPEDS